VRIGLDLDNTLICYERAFASASKFIKLLPQPWSGSKKELKRALLSQPSGERLWQSLQGQVYGTGIVDAELFPGVERFMLRCRYRGYDVFIVSHKTEFGHFDVTRAPLRKAAMSWMQEKGFFYPSGFGIPKDNVYFMDTRKRKVSKISKLNLDVFVDDLEEVFDEKEFPSIKKVLFSNEPDTIRSEVVFGNWCDIEEHLLGPISKNEVAAMVREHLGCSINSIRPIFGGGNNRLYQVTDSEGQRFAIKFYPDVSLDSRPRLQAEVSACQLLRKLDVTPSLRWYDQRLNFAIFDWIDGVSPDIDDDHLRQATEFIGQLRTIFQVARQSFAPASEACLSISELLRQIDNRISNLELNQDPDLVKLLAATIKPLRRKLDSWVTREWSTEQIRKCLPLSKQTLSPSDFGFHNALQKKDGGLCFFDFEYFGRDDPVKLAADFLWHPGMVLTSHQKRYWLKNIIILFGDDPELRDRFRIAWPLFGLRWALILLNEFRQDGWKKRVYAQHGISSEESEKKTQQLKKAAAICRALTKENFECPYV